MKNKVKPENVNSTKVRRHNIGVSGIGTSAGTSAPRPMPVSKNTEKKKKNEWDIPFRTEKGDTTFSGSFSEKTLGASLSKQTIATDGTSC
jgi:hypothetical protein